MLDQLIPNKTSERLARKGVTIMTAALSTGAILPIKRLVPHDLNAVTGWDNNSDAWSTLVMERANSTTLLCGYKGC